MKFDVGIWADVSEAVAVVVTLSVASAVLWPVTVNPVLALHTSEMVHDDSRLLLATVKFVDSKLGTENTSSLVMSNYLFME